MISKIRCRSTGWKTMSDVIEYPRRTCRSSRLQKPPGNVSVGQSGSFCRNFARNTTGSLSRSRMARLPPTARTKWQSPSRLILAWAMGPYTSASSATRRALQSDFRPHVDRVDRDTGEMSRYLVATCSIGSASRSTGRTWFWRLTKPNAPPKSGDVQRRIAGAVFIAKLSVSSPALAVMKKFRPENRVAIKTYSINLYENCCQWYATC